MIFLPFSTLVPSRRTTSGTDRPNVVEEADLLGLTEVFVTGDEIRIRGANLHERV